MRSRLDDLPSTTFSATVLLADPLFWSSTFSSQTQDKRETHYRLHLARLLANRTHHIRPPQKFQSEGRDTSVNVNDYHCLIEFRTVISRDVGKKSSRTFLLSILTVFSCSPCKYNLNKMSSFLIFS